MFTQMSPGRVALGSDPLARPRLSGCELGSFRRTPAGEPARDAAIAAERGRPAVDNNLIAVGVSRIMARPVGARTAMVRGVSRGFHPAWLKGVSARLQGKGKFLSDTA